MNAPRSKRRWLQFSLRTIFVLMTVLGLWLGITAHRARRQKEAVEAILALGGHVTYGYEVDELGLPRWEFDQQGRPQIPDGPPVPKWLRRAFGDDYFVDVVDVALGGPDLTDADLVHLGKLPHLRRLLVDGRQLTGDGLHYLSGLTRLETLRVWPTNDAGSEHLKGLTSLKVLDFSGSEITDAGLERLSRLTNLESLTFNASRITENGLRHLQHLANLRTLKIDNRVNDAGLEHLAGLTRLESLSFQGPEITDAGMQHLRRLTHLQRLTFHAPAVSDSALTPLEELACLDSLTFNSLWVTDKGLERLEKALPNTQIIASGRAYMEVDRKAPGSPVIYIDLTDTNLTDFSLAPVRRYPKVGSLALGGTRVSDDGLRYLENLAELESLQLHGTEITDAALESLEGLTKLKSLSLSNTRLTDAGVAHLEGLVRLEELYLDDTGVTDAGLGHLKGLTNLRLLWLQYTPVTDEGAAKLQQALPDAEIRW
jgi:Leucine-rich repeat (LRR) protein